VTPRRQLSEYLLRRAAKRLDRYDNLLLGYALRCGCRDCGKIMRWQPDDDVVVTAECCGHVYRLVTRSVVVEIDPK